MAEASTLKQEQVRAEVEAMEGLIAASRVRGARRPRSLAHTVAHSPARPTVGQSRCAMFKHVSDRTAASVRALRTDNERVINRELEAMREDVRRLAAIEASVMNTAVRARARGW